MAIGLMGGLGRALVEGANQLDQTNTSERERKRREGIENKALARQEVLQGRQDTEWERAQATQAGQDTATDALINQHLDPTWNPADQFWKHSQAWTAPTAAAQQPPAPESAIPSPVAGLPTVTTQPKGLWSVTPAGLKTGQPVPGGAPAATPAPGAGPTQATAATLPPTPVMPPELHDISQGYRDIIERPLQNGIASLQAQGKDTPAARRALFDAITNTQKAKDLDSKMNAYVETTRNNALRERAMTAGMGIMRHDRATIEGIFGKGAQWGIDPKNGLDGVRLADGSMVGADIAMATAMFRAGALDQKEYVKIWTDAANNRNKMLMDEANNQTKRDLKAMPNISVTIAGGGADANKMVQQANEAQKTAHDRYLLDNPGDESGAQKAGLDAKQGILSAPATRADAYEDRMKNLHLEALKKESRQMTLDAINKSVGKDPNTGEAKALLPAEQCLEQFKVLMKKDPAAAIQYSANLTSDQTPLIKAEVAKMERENAVKSARAAAEPGDTRREEQRSKTNPFQKPTGAPKPPKMGEVRNGYRFKGGDPSKPENWEKV